MVQRTHRGCPARAPVEIRRRSQTDPRALSMALQPTAATTSAGRQNALAGRERLIQNQTRAAQEKFLPDLTGST